MPINRKFVVVVQNRLVSQHNKRVEAQRQVTRLKKHGFYAQILRRDRKTRRGILYRKVKK